MIRLVNEEYRTIVLHSPVPGRDPFGLVDYLRGTWPSFLRTVKVQCVAGEERHIWNAERARFEPEAPLPKPAPRPQGPVAGWGFEKARGRLLS